MNPHLDGDTTMELIQEPPLKEEGGFSLQQPSEDASSKDALEDPLNTDQAGVSSDLGEMAEYKAEDNIGEGEEEESGEMTIEDEEEEEEEKEEEEEEVPKKRGKRGRGKGRSRTKRNVASIDSQVTASFTFMRKRRQDLTLGAKVKVLEMLDHEPKVPQGKIASMFRVSQSQVSRIMKNKEAIMGQWNRFATPDRKRCRLGKAGALEQKLVDWYKEAKKDDLPISGPILMEKAKSIGNEMGITFKPSAGWLGRWKDRNGVTLKRFKDKDGVLSFTKIGNHWRRYIFTKATKDMSPQNVWVVDETVLAYNAVPDCMMQGNPSENEVMTIILACNIAGTERLPPMVVGRSQALGSFNLPVPYHYHPKAAVTLELFSAWLRDWDRELRAKKKKIVLVLNKAPYHPENLHLFNITITHFPSGTTSLLQPLQLGIISAFKALYRHQQLKYMLAKIHANEHIARSSMLVQNMLSAPSLNLFMSIVDTIFMIHKAWRHVSPETIVKGAVKAGLSKDVDALNVNDQVIAPPGISQQDFDNFLTNAVELDFPDVSEESHCPRVNPQQGVPVSTIGVQYPHTSNMYNDSSNKLQQQINHGMDTSLESMPSLPKVSEAVIACQVLRRYLQQLGGRLFDEFSELESAIQLDMILERRPEISNEFHKDPLHDKTSVHSLHAHQVSLDQRFDYLAKIQKEMHCQKLQKEMKKSSQSAPADQSQHPHCDVSTPTQELRNDVHHQLLKMQRHDIHTQELGRQQLVRQELPQPMQHPNVIRQEIMRPDYRQDAPPQERSVPPLIELKNFRPIHPDGRNMRNDGKNDTVVTSMPTDLRNLSMPNPRTGVEIHHPGLAADMSQNMRQPDTRLENPGIPYYAIANPLHHHYMQAK